LHAKKELYSLGGLMTDKIDNVAKPQTGAAPGSDQNSGHNLLIEIILILFLVGLIFVFIFPYLQLKEDKKAEILIKEKLLAAIPTLEKISDAAYKMKAQDDFAAFAMDFDFLGIGKKSDFETDDFTFGYEYIDDETANVFALTKAAFGKDKVKIIYDLKNKSYSISDPEPEAKPIIKEEWLP